MTAIWWDEMADVADDHSDGRFSASWYREMNRLYLERFPDADERSKTNMREMAEWAAAKEQEVSA